MVAGNPLVYLEHPNYLIRVRKDLRRCCGCPSYYWSP